MRRTVDTAQHSGRSGRAISADDRPELFQQQVEAGLSGAEDVYEGFDSP